MHYNNFKNEFIADLSQLDLKLTKEQMNKILQVLDQTAKRYDILNKNSLSYKKASNGVPQSVYDYIDCKRAEGLTEGTLYTYRILLESFFITVNKPPEYVDAQDIMTFLRNYQNDNHICNRTLDKYRGHICCYFTFIHDFGYITRNPARQVKKIKYEIKPMPILNEYEVELVRDSCITRREKAIVEFLISTACRVGELIVVKIEDINWDTDEVILFGKGSKYRTGFITPRCKLALQRYLEYRDELDPEHPCEYLFIHERYPYKNLSVRGVEDILERIMKRIPAITKHVTPHRMRNHTATIAYEHGMNIKDISDMLGHSSTEVTEKFYVQQSSAHVHNEHRRFIH